MKLSLKPGPLLNAALMLLLCVPVMAQDDKAQRGINREEMRAQREEFMRNNPEAAAEMQARRAERQEFLDNNPEAAAQMAERRAKMQEFRRNNPDAQFRGPGERGPGGRGPSGEGHQQGAGGRFRDRRGQSE